MFIHFEEVYTKSDPGDEFESGFQLARDFPNTKIKRLTSTGDDILFMVYDGEEPNVERIEAGLKSQKMEAWMETYLDDLNDELNQQIDDAIHNT